MSMTEAARGLEAKLAAPLLILRVATGLFLLQWSVEKVIAPEKTIGIFGHFYGLEITAGVAIGLGVLQILLVAGFLIGLVRQVTYGIAFIIHLISTVSTWQQLINPYEGGNHLFAAAVPVLAGLWLLYTLREHDTYTVDHRREQAVAPAGGEG